MQAEQRESLANRCSWGILAFALFAGIAVQAVGSERGIGTLLSLEPLRRNTELETSRGWPACWRYEYRLIQEDAGRIDRYAWTDTSVLALIANLGLFVCPGGVLAFLMRLAFMRSFSFSQLIGCGMLVVVGLVCWRMHDEVKCVIPSKSAASWQLVQ